MSKQEFSVPQLANRLRSKAAAYLLFEELRRPNRPSAPSPAAWTAATS